MECCPSGHVGRQTRHCRSQRSGERFSSSREDRALLVLIMLNCGSERPLRWRPHSVPVPGWESHENTARKASAPSERQSEWNCDSNGRWFVSAAVLLWYIDKVPVDPDAARRDAVAFETNVPHSDRMRLARGSARPRRDPLTPCLRCRRFPGGLRWLAKIAVSWLACRRALGTHAGAKHFEARHRAVRPRVNMFKRACRAWNNSSPWSRSHRNHIPRLLL